MKWTWEQFGFYVEPDQPELEKLDAATVDAPKLEPATIDPTVVDSGVADSAAVDSETLDFGTMSAATIESETPESVAPKVKALQAPKPVPPRRQRIRRIILECLHLSDVPEIEVQFYEPIRKTVVVVQAKEVNPTWQEILDASRESGWEVEVFARSRFERLKRSALHDFAGIPAVTPSLAQSLVRHGYFTLQDFAAIGVNILMRLGRLDRIQAAKIIQQAEFHAEQLEF